MSTEYNRHNRSIFCLNNVYSQSPDSCKYWLHINSYSLSRRSWYHYKGCIVWTFWDMPWCKLLDQKLSGDWILWQLCMGAGYLQIWLCAQRAAALPNLRRMVTTLFQGFEESLQHPIRPQSSEHGFRVQCLPYMDSSELWIFHVRKVLSSDTSVASILETPVVHH